RWSGAMKFSATVTLLTLVVTGSARAQPPDPLNAANEQALKEAARRAAASVVAIETSGGTEMVGPAGRGQIRKGVGPTTGLVVGADGYIISSAFNFANKP